MAAQGAANLESSVCRGKLWWPSSIFVAEKCLLCTNWSPSWQPPVMAPILGAEAEFCVERRKGDRWPWSRAESSWITALTILEPSHQGMSPRTGTLCPQNHTGSYLFREKFLTPATQGHSEGNILSHSSGQRGSLSIRGFNFLQHSLFCCAYYKAALQEKTWKMQKNVRRLKKKKSLQQFRLRDDHPNYRTAVCSWSFHVQYHCLLLFHLTSSQVHFLLFKTLRKLFILPVQHFIT